jgi:hypothetical protein
MSDTPTRLPEHLPVLTEVLEGASPRPAPVFEESFPKIELDFADAVVVDDPVLNASSPSFGKTVVTSQAQPQPPLDSSYLAQRVRSNVQLQLEHMLEARLREAVLPMLTQQTDLLVQRLRADLMFWLDDMVERAVAQEISRRNV